MKKKKEKKKKRTRKEQRIALEYLFQSQNLQGFEIRNGKRPTLLEIFPAGLKTRLLKGPLGDLQPGSRHGLVLLVRVFQHQIHLCHEDLSPRTTTG